MQLFKKSLNKINVNDKSNFLKNPWVILASSITIAMKVTIELIKKLPFIFRDIRNIKIFKVYITILKIFLEKLWFKIVLDIIEFDVSKSGNIENNEQTATFTRERGLLNSIEACNEANTPIVKWVLPRIRTSCKYYSLRIPK